ncbi:MAG: NADH-quinone oxidoreductase subunit N [Syntrophobacteraceae bacterium]|nr:NADH-quinone oxidoreductase subunit N [Syntrophobacteraceae bacterium]
MTPAGLLALLPLICLGAAAVLVMLLVAVRRTYTGAAVLTLVGLGAAFLTLPFTAGANPHRLFLLMLNGYTAFYAGLLVLAAAASVLMSFSYMSNYLQNREEFFILLLLATLGATVLAASDHFATFFLGFELLSVSLYSLIAYPYMTQGHIEAAIKYLVPASVSSAFLLFGMALIYAWSGQMEISRIGFQLRSIQSHAGHQWMIAGLSMIVVAIGFKLALAPFHLWAPDVYQGAPAPVTAFIATVSKGAVVALLLRLFTPADIQTGATLFYVFSLMAAVSMIAGNLLALLQNNVKRILAYSSIAHLGYILVAFLAGGARAIDAVTFYLVTYFIATLGSFGVISALSSPGREMEDLADYRGFSRRNPWLTGVFTVMVLSLAGLPLTAGFIGKFYLALAGVGAALWTLVIILVLTSTIGLYYYLRILVALFVAAPEGLRPEPPFSYSNTFLLALLTFLLFWLGVMPTPIIALIRTMVR